MYRVLKLHLVAAYQGHLAVANPIYEPPTRRVLRARLIVDEEARARAARWEQRLLEMLTAAGGVTGDGYAERSAPRDAGTEDDVPVAVAGPAGEAVLDEYRKLPRPLDRARVVTAAALMGSEPCPGGRGACDA